MQEEENCVGKTAETRNEDSGLEKKVTAQNEESSLEKKVTAQNEESSLEIEREVESQEEGGVEKNAQTQKDVGSFAKKIKIWVIVGFVLIILLCVKQFLNQKIDSVESLQLYMKRFGVAAPLMLTLFQGLQVVVPVLPGYLGCAAGAVAFGTMTGFWCNYIGISLGSIIAFFLGKKYGKGLILSMFPQKQYEKWSVRVQRSRSYDWFLFIATLLPLFPDDFLCYFSGLIKMNSKKFIWIIILGKPWCILAYSIVFGWIK